MSDTIANVTYSQNGKLYAGMKKEEVRTQIDMQEFKTDKKREKAYNKQIKIFDYADGLVDGVKDGVISEEEILAYDKKEKQKKTWKTIGLIALGIGLTVGTIVMAKKLKPKIQYKMAMKKYMQEHFGKDIPISDISREAHLDRRLLELPEKYRGFGGGNSCDATTYAMEITSKERRIELAKTNSILSKKISLNPHSVELSEEEAVSKKVLEDAFRKVKPLEGNCLEHRGVILRTDSPYYEQISRLKKGDVYTEPGYIWTTPDSGYAAQYKAKTACEELARKQGSIIYNMLFKEGDRILCVDRANPETLVKGKFKVCDIIKTDNDIELFVEHII